MNQEKLIIKMKLLVFFQLPLIPEMFDEDIDNILALQIRTLFSPYLFCIDSFMRNVILYSKLSFKYQ